MHKDTFWAEQLTSRVGEGCSTNTQERAGGEVSCRMCPGTVEIFMGTVTLLEYNRVLFAPESLVLSKLLYNFVLL